MNSKKLVLHFDINGTITVYDSTDNGSEVENANVVVSKNVYGKIIDNNWLLNDQIYDENDSVTYYEYIKSTDKNYKQIAIRFTEDNNPGFRLKYMIDDIVDGSKDFFFKSFLKVIETYPKAQIILRTFGRDRNLTIETLQSKFPSFNNIQKCVMNYDNDIPELIMENTQILTGLDMINDFIASLNSHLFIQESFKYWNSKGKSKKYGKQMTSHQDMIQLFFDDNDCVNVVDDIDAKSFKINTLNAYVNEDYYLNLIKIRL
jgi:hypothetical protein